MSMDASGPVGPFCRGPACQRGLTLVELLTSLGLGLILTTLAVESYEYQVGEARADEQINRLRTALALARSEAVYRGARVVLCRRQSVSVQCAGASASGRPDWSQGWLVFLDNNNNRIYDDGDLLLRQYPALVGEFVLRWNRGDYLAYKAAGWLGSLNGTFCLGRYDDQGSVELERELKIPYTGRVRITYGECSYSL